MKPRFLYILELLNDENDNSFDQQCRKLLPWFMGFAAATTILVILDAALRN